MDTDWQPSGGRSRLLPRNPAGIRTWNPRDWKRLRIGIIGSGIAGLTVANCLHRRHKITVFERLSRIGGHINTVLVESGGCLQPIDTGFIVYNEPNFPKFSELLRTLDVVTRPTQMSFSVRHDPSGIEYGGTSFSSLFAQRRNLLRPSFLRMLLDINRFNRRFRDRTESSELDGQTVAELLARHQYGPGFVEHYLVPLGSALWSASPAAFRDFPSRFVVDFLHNHRLLQLAGRPRYRFIEGGSVKYLNALVASFRDRICLGRAARRVVRGDGFVEVEDQQGTRERFDQVVIACHADEALVLLADPHPVERELLGAFDYAINDVVLHTDSSVLPRNRRAWAAWNFHMPVDEPDSVRITYNMNILQQVPGPRVFNVTLNDQGLIAPDEIIARFRYSHPLYCARSASAQRRHGELIGLRNTSYCGAYWGYGFHEDAVRSGLAVAEHLSRF